MEDAQTSLFALLKEGGDEMSCSAVFLCVAYLSKLSQFLGRLHETNKNLFVFNTSCAAARDMDLVAGKREEEVI